MKVGDRVKVINSYDPTQMYISKNTICTITNISKRNGREVITIYEDNKFESNFGLLQDCDPRQVEVIGNEIK